MGRNFYHNFCFVMRHTCQAHNLRIAYYIYPIQILIYCALVISKLGYGTALLISDGSIANSRS